MDVIEKLSVEVSRLIVTCRENGRLMQREGLPSPKIHLQQDKRIEDVMAS